MNEIIKKDYRNFVITKETIQNINSHPKLYIGSPIRIQMGRIYTNEEFAKRSDEVLSRELPGGQKKTLRKVFKRKRK